MAENQPALPVEGVASRDLPVEHELINEEREERQPTVSDALREEREETGVSANWGTRPNERGSFGVDFSEHTDQRQSSLSDRKKQMLQNARK